MVEVADCARSNWDSGCKQCATKGVDMRVLGFIIVLVIIVMGIYNGGDLGSFIDTAAILVILAALIGGLLMSGGGKTGAAIGCALSGETSAERLQTGRKILAAARKTVQAAAFILVGVGTIAVLKEGGEVAAIGPGLALALLGLFWGMFVAYFILMPLEAGIERRLLASGQISKASREGGLDLLMMGMVFLVVMSSMIVLMATLGK